MLRVLYFTPIRSEGMYPMFLSRSSGVVASLLVLVALAGNALGATPTLPGNEGTKLSSSTINRHLNQADERISRIQNAQVEQLKTIDALRSDQSSLTGQLQAQHAQLQRVEARLSAMDADSNTATLRNDIATAFNVIGMIFGILGGVLMAGAQLSAKQERIADIRVTRSLVDLGTREVRKEPILNFFGLLGSIAIAIGFIFQLIGALVAAPLSIPILVMSGVAALVFVGYLIVFFLRYTPDQTPSEKAAVVTYNFRRHIIQPVGRKILRRKIITCNGCLQRLDFANTQVWWLYENNIENFLYLHQPYEFHYGHEACLPQIPAFGVYFNTPARHDGLYLGKAIAKDFLENDIPRFRAWYVEFHRYWTEKRNAQSEETAWEEQLNHVEHDIRSLAS
jgi:hypothetical protein